jgi:HEAT repeat protein
MENKVKLHLLLAELYKEKKLPFFKIEIDKKVMAMKEIVALTQAKGIPYLIPICLHKNTQLSAYAIQEVSQLLTVLEKKHLIFLDQAVRELNSYEFNGIFKDWATLTPEAVQVLIVKKHFPIHLLGLLSFHRNGYIREKAVQLLSLIEDGGELPYLLLRLNDHISKIRKMAYRELIRKVKVENGSALANNLFLFQHIQKYAREPFGKLFSKLEEVLTDVVLTSTLVEKLTSKDRYVRRISLDYLLVNADTRILKAALSNPDFIVRRKAAEYICCSLGDEEKTLFYQALKKDSNMQVRKLAFQIMLNRSAKENFSEVEDYLLDSHKSIRELAQFYVGKLKLPIDMIDVYLKSVHQGVQSMAVISGIGEVGSKEHSVIVKSFVQHPRPKVRLAAVKVLAKIGEVNEETDLFFRALQDSSPKVSKIAAVALKGRIHDEERFFKLLIEEEQNHVKRNIVFLLEHQSKVQSIKALVKGLIYAPELQELIEQKILNWLKGYNRTFYLNLSGEEKRIIWDLLSQVDKWSTPDILEEFEFILR